MPNAFSVGEPCRTIVFLSYERRVRVSRAGTIEFGPSFSLSAPFSSTSLWLTRELLGEESLLPTMHECVLVEMAELPCALLLPPWLHLSSFSPRVAAHLRSRRRAL